MAGHDERTWPAKSPEHVRRLSRPGAPLGDGNRRSRRSVAVSASSEPVSSSAPYTSDAQADAVDSRLVEDHLGLARYLARRFSHRGESLEDLVQVASMGLVEAATRYDPDHGTSFPAFATATIIGTLKKHFRDRGWAVRVSRRVQELYLETRDAVDHLSQALGRSPTIDELAAHLGVGESDVIEAMEAGRLYRTASLSQALDDDTTRTLETRVGAVDPGVGIVDRRDLVRDLMSRLPMSERRVVLLRFQEGLSQAEIGSRVGVSQMQVSRLLARGLERMRAWEACA
ncbi:MAG TPA: SigB/SigF/SigG family RNA polymerase sigma factor [Acidimicrobiales bacterium]|nr:SigB/SigF/SigG family RNA polymerase sigma factor [Acidimicrobiales bacterium]